MDKLFQILWNRIVTLATKNQFIGTFDKLLDKALPKVYASACDECPHTKSYCRGTSCSGYGELRKCILVGCDTVKQLCYYGNCSDTGVCC